MSFWVCERTAMTPVKQSSSQVLRPHTSPLDQSPSLPSQSQWRREAVKSCSPVWLQFSHEITCSAAPHAVHSTNSFDTAHYKLAFALFDNWNQRKKNKKQTTKPPPPKTSILLSSNITLMPQRGHKAITEYIPSSWDQHRISFESRMHKNY